MQDGTVARGWYEVLYAALQPDCCSSPGCFPSPVRATLLRRRLELRWLFESFQRFVRRFVARLFGREFFWIEFVSCQLVRRFVR